MVIGSKQPRGPLAVKIVFWLAAVVVTIVFWLLGGVMLRRLVLHSIPLPLAVFLFAVLVASVTWTFLLIDYRLYHGKGER